MIKSEEDKKMEFRKAFEFRKSEGEINSGEVMVETAGYVPAKLRIEQIIDAGKRLVEYRKEQFDYTEGEDDMTPDIRTRSKSYDLADASQDLMEINSRKKPVQKGAPSVEKEKDDKKENVVKVKSDELNENVKRGDPRDKEC